MGKEEIYKKKTKKNKKISRNENAKKRNMISGERGKICLFMCIHLFICLAHSFVHDSLKQTELRESAIAETLHESSKPLARYNDDEDLERIRKEAMRDGDPMAAYINRKKQTKNKTAGKKVNSYWGRSCWEYGTKPLVD